MWQKIFYSFIGLTENEIFFPPLLGGVDKLRIKLSQISTKLKLKLKLSLAIKMKNKKQNNKKRKMKNNK